MAQITAEQIADLRRLLEAATREPWMATEHAEIPGDDFVMRAVWLADRSGMICEGQDLGAGNPADMPLVAMMRNVLPTLLDELERLRALEAVVGMAHDAILLVAVTLPHQALTESQWDVLQDANAALTRAMIRPES